MGNEPSAPAPSSVAPQAKPKPKPKPKPKRQRTVVAAIGAVIVAGLLWLVFSPNPLQLELTRVVQGPLQVTINNQGQVRVHEKYIVAAPVSADLQRIALRDGDPVRKDQVVAILDPLPIDVRQKQEARARVEAAKALARESALRTARAYSDLQFAISERARTEQLVKDRFVSPQSADRARTTEVTARADWNAAKSREEAAVADVRAAEAALIAANAPARGPRPQMQLTSPVDGYVLKVNEKSQRTVVAGTPLVTIGDPARYEIVVDVLSTDAVKIGTGNLMLLEGWGGGKTLRARVRLVEPVAFTKISALGVEEQRVNVIADPVDPLGPLGDSYRIEARIVIWSRDNVTKLAGSSVFRVGDRWHVFVIENGRAREREIEVGQRNQDDVQIISGLAPGALVVRYPGNQIRDGVRVVASNPSVAR